MNLSVSGRSLGRSGRFNADSIRRRIINHSINRSQSFSLSLSLSHSLRVGIGRGLKHACI